MSMCRRQCPWAVHELQSFFEKRLANLFRRERLQQHLAERAVEGREFL